MIGEYGDHVSFGTDDPRGTVAVFTFEHAASSEADVTSIAEGLGYVE